MDSVKIDRIKLLDVLKTNRTEHEQTVNEAFTKYRELVIVELDKMIAEARSGKKIRRAIDLIEPMDMTDTYDTAILMLEMSIDKHIELTTMEFQQYVEDKWHWSNQFDCSNAVYTMQAN